MQPITTEELREYAPGARDDYVQALVQGWPRIQEAGINTPQRWCHFIAQCFHETGGFTIVRENMKYSVKNLLATFPHRFAGPTGLARARVIAGNPQKVAESVYGRRMGNDEPGDGYKYRGGGFFQTTGRSAYRKYSALVGVDLEANPDWIERGDISLMCALAEWKQINGNKLADENNLRAIGNGINRGNPYSSLQPIGATGRTAAFQRAWHIWGEGQPGTTAKPGEYELGAHGFEIEAIQRRLHELNRPCGKVDGIYGPETARAIAGFKADWQRDKGEQLEPGDTIGPLTRAALEAAEPVKRPGRDEATAKDLVAAGSETMKGAETGKVVAGGTVIVAGAQGVEASGGIEAIKPTLQAIPEWKGVLVATVEAAQWGIKHAAWIATGILGFVAYRTFGRTIWTRLKDHWTGRNLSR